MTKIHQTLPPKKNQTTNPQIIIIGSNKYRNYNIEARLNCFYCHISFIAKFGKNLLVMIAPLASYPKKIGKKKKKTRTLPEQNQTKTPQKRKTKHMTIQNPTKPKAPKQKNKKKGY